MRLDQEGKMRMVLLCLLLMGCQTVVPLRHGVQADIAAARAMACAEPQDVLACPCFEALDAKLSEHLSLPDAVGPLSELMRIRLARQSLDDGLKLACGGLVMDVRLHILNLGSLLTGLR